MLYILVLLKKWVHARRGGEARRKSMKWLGVIPKITIS